MKGRKPAGNASGQQSEDPLPLAAYMTLMRLIEWKDRTPGPIKTINGRTIAGMPKSTVEDDLRKLEKFHGEEMSERKKGKGAEKGLRLTRHAEALAAFARPLFETAKALEGRRSLGRPVLRLGGYNTNFRDLTVRLLRPGDPPFDTLLVPAQSQKEMIRHLRAGITDLAFSYVPMGTTPDYIADGGTFGHAMVGSHETIPIVSQDFASGGSNLKGIWGGPEGFESLKEVAAHAERLIFDEIALPEIRNDLPPHVPLVLCDSQGTVTTLVRQNRGVGLIWDMPILLTDGIVRGRFKRPIRTPINVYAVWRNDERARRLEVEGDPMELVIKRLEANG